MIPTFRTNIKEAYDYLENDKEVTRVFEIDWDNNRLLSRHIDGVEAVGQMIDVVCAINLKETEIMPDWFGNEFASVYGMPRSFVKANIERLIKEALSTDSRVKGFNNFVITDLPHAIKVQFEVVCEDKVFTKEVTINNV